MLSDHQLLVGRYDVDRNAAVGIGYQARVAGILGRIERNTEPPQLIGNARPDMRRIFSNAGCEDESVQPLQRGRKHTCIEADPINEIIDRQFRLGFFAGL